MTAKPTFVLLPGAFHYKECLAHIAAALQSAGFPVRIATLKSVNDAQATLTDDINLIRNDLLDPLINENKDVIVVCHSYAGVPTSVAITGLSKNERATKGLQGGVIGAVYMAAFIPHEGKSVKEMLGGQWAPWQREDESAGLLMVTTPMPTLYADVPEAIAAMSVTQVKGHSVKALLEQTPPVGYSDKAYDGRRAYIRCDADAALPVFVQDMMMETSGTEWIVKTMKTGHSPFLADPAGLASMLGDLSKGFLAIPTA